jgi:putative ABC transport system ATP-binding protein
MYAIETKNLCKSFQTGDNLLCVLNNISIQIQQQEMTLLVGPSGCGKTTLISVISGILSETSGEVVLFDQSLKGLSNAEKILFRRKNIGFIFQQYNLLPALSARENAALPLIAAGFSFEKACLRADPLLAQLGLEQHLHHYPRHLSGGQQQRVAIARALIHAPRLIICDEPTAALDAHSGKEVLSILKERTQEHKTTVLIVTHDSRIYSFADRILQMEDGVVIQDQRISFFSENP